MIFPLHFLILGESKACASRDHPLDPPLAQGILSWNLKFQRNINLQPENFALCII